MQCCVRAEFPGPLEADAVNSLEVCARACVCVCVCVCTPRPLSKRVWRRRSFR